MKKLFLFLQRSARRPEASGAKGMPVTQLATSSQHSSTTGSIFPSEAIWNDSQSYYELAQRLQKVLPPGLNRLGSGDIQIVDTQPFASGGFSEVWKGTLQGRPVAVKSLRCYSSPEFDPAKVGIVSRPTTCEPESLTNGVQRSSTRRYGHPANSRTLISSRFLACTPPLPTPLLLFTK